MLTRILISGTQFILSVVMAGFVIYYTYRAFIKANPDFNMEESIKKGNIAVGILVSTNVYCASMMLHKTFGSVGTMVKMYAYSPSDYTINAFQLGLISIAHIVLKLVKRQTDVILQQCNTLTDADDSLRQKLGI